MVQLNSDDTVSQSKQTSPSCFSFGVVIILKSMFEYIHQTIFKLHMLVHIGFIKQRHHKYIILML